MAKGRTKSSEFEKVEITLLKTVGKSLNYLPE